jgi:hypothetical protein
MLLRDRVSTAKLRPLVLALVAAGFLFHALSMSGWLIDDAYISFRYARNLASGAGLVFNPGERVEGYTNFSWVIVAAIASKLGLGLPFFMPLLGVVCALGVVLLVARAAPRYWPEGEEPGRACAGVGAAAMMALSPDLARYSVSGLETALYTLLITAAVVSLIASRPVAFACFTSAAFLTRPDAALIGIVGVVWLMKGADRVRATLRAVAVFVVLLGPYLVFKWRYFGALAPNTLAAKVPDVRSGFLYVAGSLVSIGPIAAAVAFFVARDGRRFARPIDRLFVLWLVTLVAVALEGGDWMNGHRLTVQYLPLLALAADRFVVQSFTAASNAVAKIVRPTAVLVCIPLGLMGTREITQQLEYREVVDARRERVVRELAAAGVHSLGTFDVGLVGWVAPSMVITDLGGLTDRTIAHAPGHYFDKKPDPLYLAARDPDAFLFTTNLPPKVEGGTVLIASHYECEDYVKALPWFASHYAYRKTFSASDQGTYYLHWFARRN